MVAVEPGSADQQRLDAWDADRRSAEAAYLEANPDLAFFVILDVTSTKLPADTLEVALAAQIRADDGDIVAMNQERCIGCR